MALAAALVPFLASRSAEADADPWWGGDKGLHFSVNVGIVLGGYGGTALVTESYPTRALVGASLGAAASLGKELADAAGAGDPSLRDLAWDAGGIALGLVLATGIDWAIHDERHRDRTLATKRVTSRKQ